MARHGSRCLRPRRQARSRSPRTRRRSQSKWSMPASRRCARKRTTSICSYGSSFLVGPVETAGRPFVDIKEIVFDPATLTFRLAFAGGGASLHVGSVDEERITIEIKLDMTVEASRPFAALRSMFVTGTNAD